MNSFQYRGIKHKSRSQAAVKMLKNTKRSQTEIARILEITPQTVNAIKRIHKVKRPS